MLNMWERIDRLKVRNFAIVGVSKHAGKTTTLNRMIRDAAFCSRRLALASIGVDGERIDHVAGTPKPEIWVPTQTVFATAISVMTGASAPVEWQMPTGIDSPFGEVWIGKTTASGTICLAGVRQLDHLQTLLAMFQRCTIDHVIWDGALSRMIAANPQVSDGVMLATGAVVGTLAQVVHKTQQVLRRITLPILPERLAHQLPAVGSGVLIVTVSALQKKSLDLSNLEVRAIYPFPDASAFTEDVRTLMNVPDEECLFVYGGAVTDQVLRTLQNREQIVTVVAASPAHVFVSEAVWRSFARAGHRLVVRQSAALIGITVNPVSPCSAMLDRQQLKQSIQSLADVPVWDVME